MAQLETPTMSEPAEPSGKKPPTSRGGSPVEGNRMSFGDHLEELRNSLIRGLLGVFAGTIICLIFGRQIMQVLYYPLFIVQHYNGLPIGLQALAPTAGFAAYLKIGMLSGLILTMPWVLYQAWSFIASGLYPHEKRFVNRLMPTSMGLFACGVLFLYFLVLPIVLQFFISFNKRFNLPDVSAPWFDSALFSGEEDAPPTGADTTTPLDTLPLPLLQEDPESPPEGATWFNQQQRRIKINTPEGIYSIPLSRDDTFSALSSQFSIDFYISFVLTMALAFGIAFETPIVVFFLAWSGIVPAATMAGGRRYVLFGIVVAAAMLTPPDVISQVLLAGPMYLLFELGLLAARMSERKSAAD